MKKCMAMVLAAVLVCACVAQVQADSGIMSSYGSITATNAFTARWTVPPGYRLVLESVLVGAPTVTNSSTWTVSVVNNNGTQTNVIYSGTVAAATPNLVYEGKGTIPVGAGGTVIISGTMLPAGIVQYMMNTRGN